MGQQKLGMVDQETGELLAGGVLVYVPQRAKIREGWFMGFQAGFMELAKDAELQGQPLRVLVALFAKLDFENYIALSQADLARDLNMGRNRVNEALSKLKARGVILPGPKVGTAQTYRLNPGYAWKGNVKNLEAARKSHLKVV
jgi:hypothetical protein